MKKTILTILFLVSPFLVSADSYDGPYCFEDVSMNTKDSGNGEIVSSIRGTCREIKIYNTVSLDPSLKKDYLLGTHEAIRYGCDREGCAGSTKYSEALLIVSSSTISDEVLDTDSNPLQVSVFDKSFFVPSLVSLFKKENVPFSEDTFPVINLHLFKKEEFEKFQNEYSTVYIPKQLNKDTLMINDDYYSSAKYNVYTFLYQEYGKYIHAPKGELNESQYADFVYTKNILSNKDLGIKVVQAGRTSVASVSLTSPLVQVTNHWLFTKKNGKITLVWKSVDYSLNDGTVKTITLDDKNVSTALLFAGHSSLQKTASTSSSTLENLTKSSPVQKMSVFKRFVQFVTSWFR